MRLRKLSSQAAIDMSEFSNFLLGVGEGNELKNNDQTIDSDEKYVVPGENISDLVNWVYGNIHE